MNKKIFGYNFHIRHNGFVENLIPELRFYPDIGLEGESLPRGYLDFVEFEEDEYLSSNPSLVKVYNNGFSAQFGHFEI